MKNCKWKILDGRVFRTSPSNKLGIIRSESTFADNEKESLYTTRNHSKHHYRPRWYWRPANSNDCLPEFNTNLQERDEMLTKTFIVKIISFNIFIRKLGVIPYYFLKSVYWSHIKKMAVALRRDFNKIYRIIFFDSSGISRYLWQQTTEKINHNSRKPQE